MQCWKCFECQIDQLVVQLGVSGGWAASLEMWLPWGAYKVRDAGGPAVVAVVRQLREVAVACVCVWHVALISLGGPIEELTHRGGGDDGVWAGDPRREERRGVVWGCAPEDRLRGCMDACCWSAMVSRAVFQKEGMCHGCHPLAHSQSPTLHCWHYHSRPSLLQQWQGVGMVCVHGRETEFVLKHCKCTMDPGSGWNVGF